MSFTSIETAQRTAALEKKRKEGGDVMGTMTLRDYFAAKAMPAILAQMDVCNGKDLTNSAWIAYQMADAMMKAREA